MQSYGFIHAVIHANHKHSKQWNNKNVQEEMLLRYFSLLENVSGAIFYLCPNLRHTGDFGINAWHQSLGLQGSKTDIAVSSKKVFFFFLAQSLIKRH